MKLSRKDMQLILLTCILIATCYELARLSTPPIVSNPQRHVPLGVFTTAGQTHVTAAVKGQEVNELIPTQGVTAWETYHEFIQDNMKNKLNHSKYTKFVDKLLFKEYCRSKGVPTLETLASYPQSEYATIPFDSFWGNFAIKSNKASGRNIFIRGKYADYNDTKIREVISHWGANYAKEWTGEPQYEFTASRIFLEPLLSPVPPDIKTYMYGSEVGFVTMKFGTGIFTYMDDSFKVLNTSRYRMRSTEPDNYDLVDDLRRDHLIGPFRDMIRRLGNDPLLLDLVVFRIDCYYYNHTLVANEITLTPSGGVQIAYLKEKENATNTTAIV